MNLYLILPFENHRYDTYDAAVVAAETKDEACRIHPGKREWGNDNYSWAQDPVEVVAKLLGVAIDGTPSGVVLASFNAG